MCHEKGRPQTAKTVGLIFRQLITIGRGAEPRCMSVVVRRSVRSRTVTPVNWDRGLFRLWCLTSAAWPMSWALCATISNLGDGLWSGAVITIPWHSVRRRPPCYSSGS
jgi:hypothetical protein